MSTESPKNARQPIPDWLNLLVYGATASAIVCLPMPFLWPLAVPLAVVAAVAAWYAAGKYKRTNGLMVAMILAVIAAGVGLSHANQVNDDIRREEPRR